MQRQRRQAPWKGLDKDLRQQTLLELGTAAVVRPLVAPGIALVFLGLSAVIGARLAGYGADRAVVIAAAALAGYMALNIGANDIGNNMGPVVGSGVAPLWLVLIVAALAEAAGAILAGGPVVRTIAFGLLQPGVTADPADLVLVMLAGLTAAALWINLATLLSASISTTHSIIGGITGAGLTAFGAAAVNWPSLAFIASAWVISPLIGGGLAAGLLALIGRLMEDAPDRRAAAVRWVPVMIGLMAGAFTAFLLATALQPFFGAGAGMTLAAGTLVAGLTVLATRPVIRRHAARDPRPAKALRGAFGLPLLIAAVLFSFAHGASDVSRAVGPLVAILAALGEPGPSARPVGTDILALGAAGIALGILLFGPRLIRVVGQEITRLNPVRAYCVLLAAAITATGAAWAGLPVSSTHIALGGIFGIGFLREAREKRLAQEAVAPRQAGPPPEERHRRKLVRRSLFFTMVAAWIITLPVTGSLAALIFLALRLLG